jgi:hypothetical protein
MGGPGARDRLHHVIPELVQVEPCEEVLSAPEERRPDREVKLVDRAEPKVLAHRGDPAADPHIHAPSRFAREAERLLRTLDEMKDRPPFISRGARGWCVSTNTGTRYGGSSPHQPLHVSSGHGPRTGPNMFRPRIHAPTFSNPRAASSSSRPVVPPSAPILALKVRVGRNHRWSSEPRAPMGSSRLCRGPAP